MTTAIKSVSELTDSELADAFDKAAEIVTERGLNKDGNYVETEAYHDPALVGTCRVCLFGALGLALNYSIDDFDAPDEDAIFVTEAHVKRTMDVIEAATGIESATAWNDAPNTTVEDVAGALRKTAAYLRESA